MSEIRKSPGLAAKRAFLRLSVEARGRVLQQQAQEAQAEYAECAKEREIWQGCQSDDPNPRRRHSSR